MFVVVVRDARAVLVGNHNQIHQACEYVHAATQKVQRLQGSTCARHLVEQHVVSDTKRAIGVYDSVQKRRNHYDTDDEEGRGAGGSDREGAGRVRRHF